MTSTALLVAAVALLAVVGLCALVLGARAGERNVMERWPEDLPTCAKCRTRHIPGLPCGVGR